MEVDSDSEQPSGSGTVSKDKKRCVPGFHYYQAYKGIQSYLWRHFDRNEFVSNFCLALNMKQFFVFLQIWGEEMECCCSLGLGHCCRQLCNLQVSLNLIEFCSCYSETYRNHTVAPHTLSQNSIFIIQWSGTTSWTCALSARPTRLRPLVRSALWLGECESHSENCSCLEIHS